MSSHAHIEHEHIHPQCTIIKELLKLIYIVYPCSEQYFKDEVEFLACDCIVKETVSNRPEKVDNLA